MRWREWRLATILGLSACLTTAAPPSLGNRMDIPYVPGGRALQLFDDVERPAALDCLAARFGERATFLSHQHSGRWRPGDARTHFAEAWCTSRGFTLIPDAGSDPSESAPRLALLMFTSG